MPNLCRRYVFVGVPPSLLPPPYPLPPFLPLPSPYFLFFLLVYPACSHCFDSLFLQATKTHKLICPDPQGKCKLSVDEELVKEYGINGKDKQNEEEEESNTEVKEAQPETPTETQTAKPTESPSKKSKKKKAKSKKKETPKKKKKKKSK